MVSGPAVDNGARFASRCWTSVVGSVPSVASLDGLRWIISSHWKTAGRCTTWGTFKRFAGAVTLNGIVGEHQTRKSRNGVDTS